MSRRPADTAVGTGLAAVAAGLVLAASLASHALAKPVQVGELLADSPAGDWRAVDPANMLVVALPGGRVTIELAPAFAPNTIANIKTLVRAHYFDGSAIVRAQDDYVVQWARADKRSIGSAKKTIPADRCVVTIAVICGSQTRLKRISL